MVLEVVDEGQGDRRRYGDDFQVAKDLPQVLVGADAALDPLDQVATTLATTAERSLCR
ncbi:hypothetical protein [Nonomuraea sp. NPDC050310]|uniref:hypothetical protein n=1 Tax=Nonomuraea sp. NPDC050310 TaxID=3154935 RepID=UPI0033DFB2A3